MKTGYLKDAILHSLDAGYFSKGYRAVGWFRHILTKQSHNCFKPKSKRGAFGSNWSQQHHQRQIQRHKLTPKTVILTNLNGAYKM